MTLNGLDILKNIAKINFFCLHDFLIFMFFIFIFRIILDEPAMVLW